MKRLADGQPVHHLPGKVIALEGIDGSGKTTQSRLLSDRLALEGFDTSLIRQPSGGKIGQVIRSALAEEISMSPHALALLFAADRSDQTRSEVIPGALRPGQRVISDRSVLSSLAYQTLLCDRQWVFEINREAIVPDLIVVVDVSPETAAKRRGARSRQFELFDESTFLRKVRDEYRKAAERLRLRGHRVAFTSCDGSIDDVAREIASLVPDTAGTAW